MVREAANSASFSVMKEAKDTFREIYQRFDGLYEDEQLREAVVRNYELCDMNFMQMLAEEIGDCQVREQLI